MNFVSRICVPMIALLAALSVRAAMVSEVAISIDEPTEKGRIVVNASLMPLETVEYSKIVFTCTLRQVIKLPAEDGGTQEKIYEPVKFTYNREGERMVKGLRKNIHFPVPVGLDELRDKYGRLTFKFDEPVTVSHVRVEAFVGSEPVWSHSQSVALEGEAGSSDMLNMMM
jgi:hypothetical protein